MNTNEQKKKSLLDLYLEKLIDKKEFEKKRNDLEAEIMKVDRELFVLQNDDVVQTGVKTIKEAFEQLRKQGEDLFHVFKTLIQEIIVHQNGTVDILYIFEKT